MKSEKVGSIVITCLFTLTNLILYFSGIITIRILTLLIFSTAYYTPFVSFDIRSTKNWIYTVIIFAVYLALACGDIA